MHAIQNYATPCCTLQDIVGVGPAEGTRRSSRQAGGSAALFQGLCAMLRRMPCLTDLTLVALKPWEGSAAEPVYRERLQCLEASALESALCSLGGAARGRLLQLTVMTERS